MKPVYTEDCNVIYKGPREDIGDLHCMRVSPGVIRVTYEFEDTEELKTILEGGRIQLFIMREPIPPVAMAVVAKEDSEPIAEHGWKTDLKPGDKINKAEKEEDSVEENSSEGSEGQNGSTPQGREAETGSA